jgi:hypothetical protein
MSLPFWGSENSDKLSFVEASSTVFDDIILSPSWRNKQTSGEYHHIRRLPLYKSLIEFYSFSPIFGAVLVFSEALELQKPVLV